MPRSLHSPDPESQAPSQLLHPGAFRPREYDDRICNLNDALMLLGHIWEANLPRGLVKIGLMWKGPRSPPHWPATVTDTSACSINQALSSHSPRMEVQGRVQHSGCRVRVSTVGRERRGTDPTRSGLLMTSSSLSAPDIIPPGPGAHRYNGDTIQSTTSSVAIKTLSWTGFCARISHSLDAPSRNPELCLPNSDQGRPAPQSAAQRQSSGTVAGCSRAAT